jgi:purine-binding chemotaxis protein CheW
MALEDIWERFATEFEKQDSQSALRDRLRQRAEQYAVPQRQVEDAAPEAARTVLRFDLGGEYYGVDVMVVRSVRTISRITRVPGTPVFYRGVVNVRGQVITVLDLRLFFDIPVTDETSPPQELVVVQAGYLQIGLLAHNVTGVQQVPLAAVESVDNMRYAWGVTKEQLVLLDVERLLEDEHLVIGSQQDEG